MGRGTSLIIWPRETVGEPIRSIPNKKFYWRSVTSLLSHSVSQKEAIFVLPLGLTYHLGQARNATSTAARSSSRFAPPADCTAKPC